MLELIEHLITLAFLVIAVAVSVKMLKILFTWALT